MVPASLIVSAYTLDRVGLAFTPGLMLGIGMAAGLGTLAALWRKSTRDAGALAAFAVIATGTYGWLLWIARPSLLPLGTGPDLTHHLQLIGYLETHWRLVHDGAIEAYLGEMVYYTPGSHVLASLAGAWSGTSGLQALHPMLSAVVALKAGFVFLIARRLLPASVPRLPIAVIGALSLFASPTFLLGSFLEFSFAAQVVAELFVVCTWWALTVWDQHPTTTPMWIAGTAMAALFLTWPVLIGPPLLLLGLLVLLPRPLPFWRRIGHALIAAGPVLVYGALFIAGRAAWIQLAGTGGKTAWPVPASYGWPFLFVSTAGLLLTTWRQRSWSAGLFAFAVLAQAGSLYWLATRQHNVPYMALKMFYVLLCAQAVGVAVALGELWRGLQRFLPTGSPPPRGGTATATVPSASHQRLAQESTRQTSLPTSRQTTRPATLAWLSVVCVALVVARSLAGAPKALRLDIQPAVSRSLALAGEWARAHVPPQCVEYLVGDDETAYWLHLAVLGNPRMSPRTGNNDTYELTPALVRWLTPGGLPYAIADLPALPRDIREELDVIASFDSAAVVKRRGLASCPEAR